jgi:catechol 2,3-dioxygenase-like lactoylglutathione lyase family enzyme
VVAFYEAAISAGAAPDGRPELHPMYGDGYFAAFVTDPDGHRLEAVCHQARAGVRFAIDHVQIAMPAGGEDAARAFYADLLGFEEIPKPPVLAKRGGAWFGAGSVRIHLGVEPDFLPAKKAHVALRCAGYDELAGRLAAAGASVLDDPLPFEGKRHCYVFDPFGNRLEIIDVHGSA